MHSQEIWKDIQGYNDLYKVSNFGNILSFRKTPKGKFLKRLKNYYGYLVVNLYYRIGKKNTKIIHRLVAEAFIDNPSNYNEINHIDGDKTNNHVSNLKWCTRSQNCQHSFDTGLKKYTDYQRELLLELNKRKRKKVYQYTKEDCFIKEWEYVELAANNLKINQSNISACCNNKCKSAGGFVWKYEKKTGK